MTERIAAIETARLPIGQLQLHPRNPRKHPEPGSPTWEILKRSLEHAYFEPLVWNRRNGCLVSGHFRWRVLSAEGYTHVDVSVVDLDEPTHYALMIAANRQLGEWEQSILASLAGEIDQAGIDAALACYDHKALMALVECPVQTDDVEETEQLVSQAEQLQEKWRVRPGDLYQVGDHRVLCGDCGSLDNWELLLPGGQADVAWWDPPYNVAYDANATKRRRERIEVPASTIENDDMPTAKYCESLRAWFGAGVAKLKPGGVVYIAHADAFTVEVRQAAAAVGIHIAQGLVWAKKDFVLSRQDYQWQHEVIIYGWRNGGRHHWQGGFTHSTVIDDSQNLKKLSKGELITLVNHLRNSTDSTVIREPKGTGSSLHPTIKPTRLVARHIWNSSARGETVLELFGGSGTTLAAAEQTGRRCVATELDPKFVAVILERMTGLGLKAEKLHGPQ